MEAGGRVGEAVVLADGIRGVRHFDLIFRHKSSIVRMIGSILAGII